MCKLRRQQERKGEVNLCIILFLLLFSRFGLGKRSVSVPAVTPGDVIYNVDRLTI